MKVKVLLVEDEKVTREGISEFLIVKGYDVVSVCDGEEAIKQFKLTTDLDLIILDIMLPKIDGFGVLSAVRKSGRDISVLMLTAMDDEATQVLSFEEKADDYISKPFSLVILEKRIEALLRRNKTSFNKNIWTYEDTQVDFIGYTAKYKNEQVEVTPKEIKLLDLLIKHSGQVLSREQILNQLWDRDEAPIDRVIDVYIKNLRKKLFLDCIKTVKGVGYKFEVSV